MGMFAAIRLRLFYLPVACPKKKKKTGPKV